MLRLIIRTDDAGMAAHVGGAVLTQFHTFDLDAPETEKLLKVGDYCHGQMVGAQVISDAEPA